ncbi:unnamed protein product [Polarella glacialis]|nr:unnamed protein product [Polarella glacialis]
MVANDGGTSQVLFHPLEFHGYDEDKTMNVGSVVASHLEQGRSDATWIFPAWEGILAARAGQELNLFKLEDFGIPYGYSPVLLAQRTALEEGPALERTRAFLAATAEGYKRAAADPHRAAAALCATGHASLSDAAFVEASAAAIAGSYLDPVAGQWGSMDAARWEAFVDFLSNAAILVNRANEPIPRTAVDVAALFSNVALPSP